MNERIQQFLLAENITQAQFADNIGVARAGISHILAGRNKPSLDFIERMIAKYPDLSIEWLISGKGRMYRNSPAESAETAISIPSDDLFSGIDTSVPTVDMTEDTEKKSVEDSVSVQKFDCQRHIDKLIVFYTDGTFEEVK